MSHTTRCPYIKQQVSKTYHVGQTGGQSVNNGVFNAPQARTLYSSSIQVTCIPDNIVVCVRKNVGGLTCADTFSYATIKNISINFNNQAGLLSSMTPEQLYRNSVQSGLANM
ncbi:MAG: major capsid protein V20 domain-containing protein, partial [Candidatus Fonsibacter sp.]